MASTRYAAIFAIACGLLTAGGASAQDADSKQAEALFLQGRDALSRGDYALACGRFRESFALVKRASPLLNLAQCEESQGKLADAFAHWKEGAAMLEPSDERLKVAGEHLRSLEPKVPRLRIRLSAGVPSTSRIELDGSPVSTASLESTIPVNPGTHQILLAVPGRSEHRHSVTVKEGEQQDVVLGAELTKPAPVTPPPPPTQSHQGRRVATWVAAGAGAAGLITATVTGVMILSKKSSADSDCPNKLCNAQGRETIDSTHSLFTVNAIGWGVGVVGAGIATWLLVTNPSEKPAPTTAIAPTWIPGGMGLTLDRRF